MENSQLTREKLVDNRLEKLGRNTPVVLIRAIQADLYEKARDWLIKSGVPADVVSAFETANMLQLYIEYKIDGRLSDWDAEEIPSSLVEATSLIIKFGGDLFSGGSWTLPDPQIPAWGDCKVSSPTTEN
jgi:hypothetical protein